MGQKSREQKNNRDFSIVFSTRFILAVAKSNETELLHYRHFFVVTLSVVTLSTNFGVTLSGPILLHYQLVVTLLVNLELRYWLMLHYWALLHYRA